MSGRLPLGWSRRSAMNFSRSHRVIPPYRSTFRSRGRVSVRGRMRPRHVRNSRRVARRGVVPGLANDVSHHHSIGRGAAYLHLLADPWTSVGVRPPTVLPVPTALIRSQTRTAYTTTAGNDTVFIRVVPGVSATASSSATADQAKIIISQFAAGVASGLARTPDRNQQFLYTSGETYRPIAMGVRILNISAADTVHGAAYGRLTVADPGTFLGDPSNTDVVNAKGDVTASVRPWPPSREIRFSWHPMSQENMEFSVVSDRGPEVGSGGSNLVWRQRSPAIDIAIAIQQATALEVEVVTWYEMVPTEVNRDVHDVDMSSISSGDVMLANQQSGVAAMRHPLDRAVGQADALSSRGFTQAVSQAFHDASQVPITVAEDTSALVQSVIGFPAQKRVRRE